MSTFWLVYLIATGCIALISAVVAILFDYDGEPVSISYLVLSILLGAIPIANFLIGIMLIVMLFFGIADGDLKPKY